MLKKIIALLLILIFGCSTSSYAFWFKKDKIQPIDLKEKYEYVNLGFFENFQDDNLVYYIEEAIKNNPSARKASWQVEEYRQNIKYSFSNELPKLSVGANYVGVHAPKFGNFDVSGNAFILPFIASYEADFFLKNRDKTKSVKKSYEASKLQEKSIYIALASDTATVYFNVLEYDKLICLQEKILTLKEDELKRNTNKYNQGVINNQQYNVIKKEFETQKNNLVTLQKNRDISLTQLALLCGKSPANIMDLKRSCFDNLEYHKSIPSEVSSDVIFSRPDILAIERSLEKSKIDIRVARKEFLPRFNITGLWAFNTFARGTFFSWESSVAAILAGATQDIFSGGRKIANLRIQKVKYEQLFEGYRQTSLNAVKEVNDSLCITKLDTQIDNNTIKYLELEQKDYKDSLSKYSRGVISYVDLINQYEKLLYIEQNQSKTKAARLVNYLTLYKALGGKNE